MQNLDTIFVLTETGGYLSAIPIRSKEINKATDIIDRDLGTGNKNCLLRHTGLQRELLRGPFTGHIRGS